MPPRNKIDTFPPSVRQMIQRKLYENGFCNYIELAAELTAAGHPITKSTLHRFGMRLQATVDTAGIQALLQPAAAEKKDGDKEVAK